MAGPLWRVIASDLQEKIETRILQPGAQLPNEVQLCEEYNVSRNTVRDAVGWLADRGMVHRRSGKGTFVVDRIDPFVTTFLCEPAVGRDETVAYMSEVLERHREPKSILTVQIKVPEGYVAEALSLAPGEAVVSRHLKRYIDDKPWSAQTSFYPVSLLQEHGAVRLIEADQLTEGTVDYLRTLGVEQYGYQDLILSRQPHAQEMEFFRLPSVGVPILEHRRTSFSRTAEPIRITVTAFPADRNLFMINVGIVPVS
jgi:GntR family transcriptional regulator